MWKVVNSKTRANTVTNILHQKWMRIRGAHIAPAAPGESPSESWTAWVYMLARSAERSVWEWIIQQKKTWLQNLQTHLKHRFGDCLQGIIVRKIRGWDILHELHLLGRKNVCIPEGTPVHQLYSLLILLFLRLFAHLLLEKKKLQRVKSDWLKIGKITKGSTMVLGCLNVIFTRA